VYNTLEALQAAGLVSLLNVVHERARYDAETDRHHHLICERCKVVRDVHDDVLDGLAAPRPAGFQVRSHSVHFYGLCPRCAAAGAEAGVARRARGTEGRRAGTRASGRLPGRKNTQSRR
jgi:Fur family peroxide stress response transcriptional regulator